MAPRRTPPRAPRADTLQSADFVTYLREKSEQMAPGDIRTLVAQAKDLRKRARGDGQHPRLPHQIDMALDIVATHHAGRCPQVPYYTIALLAVALFYYADPLDVIPDWIAGIGTADDALVMELAFQLARPGVERYCLWKDLSMEGLFPPPPAPAPAPAASRPRRPARRSRA